MVDVSVALTWVAISGISLKCLSAFGRTSAAHLAEREAREEDLPLEAIYPLERFQEGSRLGSGRRYATLSVLTATRETPAQARADVEAAGV